MLITVGVGALLLLPVVAFGVTERAAAAQSGSPPTHSKRPFAELVKEGRAWGTLLLCSATLLTLLVSYFLVSWTPTVLALNGATPQRAALAGTLLNLGGVLGAWVASSTTRGRALLLCVGGYLCGGAVLVASLGFGVLGTTLLSLLLLLATGMLIIGAQLNFAALSVYFYPVSVSATGVGLSMATGRVGSILGPLIGGYLSVTHLGWSGLFLVASIPALAAGIALALMAALPAQGTSQAGRES
jgi:MFS transporter, AAHS family, 4-hydroxybenzoate transporter